MYHDLLAKIKNAEGAQKKAFTTPFSKMDFEVAKVLVRGGYLKDAEKKTAGKKNFLEVKLLGSKKKPVVNGIKIVSRPSRHIYTDYRKLHPVRQGYGLGVISTSKGIMGDKEARKNKVGGEYLFEIW
jgi:small subunit ribosomal protein S8